MHHRVVVVLPAWGASFLVDLIIEDGRRDIPELQIWLVPTNGGCLVLSSSRYAGTRLLDQSAAMTPTSRPLNHLPRLTISS